MTSMPTAAGLRLPWPPPGPTKARDYLQAYLRFAEHVHDGELDAAAAQLTAFVGGDVPVPATSVTSDTDALVQNVQRVLAGAGYETALMPIEDAFSVDVAVLNPETGLFLAWHRVRRPAPSRA